MLLLQDCQGDTLPVIVADEDARDLLQLSPDKFSPHHRFLLTHSLHENPKLLEQLRAKLFLLWGPLEETTCSSSPPKPIYKKHRPHERRSAPKKQPLAVRFSDDISYDDDSSSSLDARYPGQDEDE